MGKSNFMCWLIPVLIVVCSRSNSPTGREKTVNFLAGAWFDRSHPKTGVLVISANGTCLVARERGFWTVDTGDLVEITVGKVPKQRYFQLDRTESSLKEFGKNGVEYEKISP